MKQLAELQHPNIVFLKEVVSRKDLLYRAGAVCVRELFDG